MWTVRPPSGCAPRRPPPPPRAGGVLEVAPIEGGRADDEARALTRAKDKDARVLEEAADDRAHADGVGEARDARPDGAHAADDDVDADPGGAGRVHRGDQHLRAPGVGR